MRLFAVALLLVVGAQVFGQEADLEAQLEACVSGVDLEAIGRRAAAFAEAKGYDARVSVLCGAGDLEGAAAFAAEVEDEFYAQDAEAARVRACMTALIGEEDPGSPCDE